MQHRLPRAITLEIILLSSIIAPLAATGRVKPHGRLPVELPGLYKLGEGV
jgi:hypothetical protein